MLNILPNSYIKSYTKAPCGAGASEMSKAMLCYMPKAVVSINNTSQEETCMDWQIVPTLKTFPTVRTKKEKDKKNADWIKEREMSLELWLS